MDVNAENLNKKMNFMRFGIEAFLVLALAFVCSQIGWRVFAPSGFAGGSGVSQNVSSAVPLKYTTQDKSILTRLNFFSSEVRKGASVRAEGIDAPETSLNLILKGVRANGEGRGVAFVLLPDNKQVRANVGTEILDGVQVEYVFEDRVTLRTRGKLETLFLRTDKAGIAGVGENRATGEVRSSVRAKAARVSAAAFSSGVSMAIVRENGTRRGYRLVPRGNSAVLTEAGFQTGDIIIRVNGRAVSEIDSEDLRALLQRPGGLDFTVNRAGDGIELSVEFTPETSQ